MVGNGACKLGKGLGRVCRGVDDFRIDSLHQLRILLELGRESDQLIAKVRQRSTTSQPGGEPFDHVHTGQNQQCLGQRFDASHSLPINALNGVEEGLGICHEPGQICTDDRKPGAQPSDSATNKAANGRPKAGADLLQNHDRPVEVLLDGRIVSGQSTDSRHDSAEPGNQCCQSTDANKGGGTCCAYSGQNQAGPGHGQKQDRQRCRRLDRCADTEPVHNTENSGKAGDHSSHDTNGGIGCRGNRACFAEDQQRRRQRRQQDRECGGVSDRVLHIERGHQSEDTGETGYNASHNDQYASRLLCEVGRRH